MMVNRYIEDSIKTRDKVNHHGTENSIYTVGAVRI